jgi:hypothetical protein
MTTLLGLLALGATALEAVTDPFGNRLGMIENPAFGVTKVR